MLFLHETHEVIGGQTAAFEAAMRDEWRPLIEADGRARLLWFWHLTHGTGLSYQVVSITAVRDWAAWGEITDAMRRDAGWQRWFQSCWSLRREVVSKLMLPAPAVDAPSLFLHDTGWPYPGKLDAYVGALGSVFYPQTARYKMIRVEACWTTAPGTGRHHEVLLLQRVLDWPAYAHMLVAGERQANPGDWMEEGLKYRDRWESKLLRPAAWSPWH
jgi:hypothetical protein